jgi:hypothetical protein
MFMDWFTLLHVSRRLGSDSLSASSDGRVVWSDCWSLVTSAQTICRWTFRWGKLLFSWLRLSQWHVLCRCYMDLRLSVHAYEDFWCVLNHGRKITHQMLCARGEKQFIRIHHRIYLCGRGSLSTMKGIIVQNSDCFGFLFGDILQSTEICPPTLIYHHQGPFPIFNCDTYRLLTVYYQPLATIRHCLLWRTVYYSCFWCANWVGTK